MGWLEQTVSNVAPIVIALSPLISYSDQAVSMHRNKSSNGFSLDVPLIMLVASLLRFVLPRQRTQLALNLVAGPSGMRSY
jgi:hypothetical protein